MRAEGCNNSSFHFSLHPSAFILMSDDYGSNAPLSYNKYLRVADNRLTGLPVDPQHHDELLSLPSTGL
jgi:hypothetical protein